MPKVVTAAEAIRQIPKGKRIFIGSGAAIPLALTNELAQNYHHLRDNELVHLLTLGEVNFLGEKYRHHIRDNSFFIGPNVRKAVNEGQADYTPIFLSEIPRLLRAKSFPIEVALIMVSPPDRNGMCSMGVSVDIVQAAMESAKVVIAQVNKNMPHTFGQALFPYSSLDYVVEANTALPELAPPQIDSVTASIGRNVSKLITDGCVLQLGIGGIPNAVLDNLHDRNDLSIHTEMFSDGVLPLMRNGNITNRSKNILKGRTATSFCFGTQALYDYVNENPLVEFYPSDFINDPFIIAQNDRMVAVNSAIEVDLTGQVCSDSMGTRFFSGIGGQVDFIRGATRSKGGRPIIALPSTAKGGTLSRIVGRLKDGAGVVTSRGDVHYIVTEYGIADLHGKTVRERALELMHVAHPQFRDELMSYGREHKYYYFNQCYFEQLKKSPPDMEEMVTFDGEQYRVRPMKITDQGKLQDFFYSHSDETLAQRYFVKPDSMTQEAAQELVDIDFDRNMALVILKKGDLRDRIIAIGRYSGEPQAESVKMAFVVDEDHRRKGMEQFLCERLFVYAKSKGVKKITALSLMSNVAMQGIFGKIQKQYQAEVEMEGEEIQKIIFSLE